MSVANIMCGLLNVQSVSIKTLDIHDIINDNILNVFAITEAWLTNLDSSKSCEITPAMHVFLHAPRERGGEVRRGDGPGAFISKSSKRIKMMPSATWENFESVQVKCDISGRIYILVGVYRPRNSSVTLFVDELTLYLETVDMVRECICVWYFSI